MDAENPSPGLGYWRERLMGAGRTGSGAFSASLELRFLAAIV